MKKIISNLFLLLAFFMLALSGRAIAEGQQSTSDKEENAKWIKYSAAKRTLVPDYLDFEVEGQVNETGTGQVEIRIKQRMVYVDCCSFKDNEYSWCDANLQDKRC